jgi:uncharacterized membrane protein YcaP (DUF421 family)
MNTFYRIDWKLLFTPSISLGELFLRGTFVYLFLFILLRCLRRETGALAISDLLLVVLIADASQHAMANDYKSITDGFILVGTIAFWNFFLDWLGYKFPLMQRLLSPSPLLLIKDGRLQRRNMRKEMITKEDLMRELREQGIDTIEDVEKSYLEAEGNISVIKKGSKEDKSH